MSFFNRFRTFPEYYDLLVGLRNYQDAEREIYAINAQTFGTVFDNLISAQQKSLQNPLRKLKSKLMETVDTMNKYQIDTSTIEKDFSTFLEEIYRLHSNSKIAMEHNRRYKKDQEEVNNIKRKITIAKTKNDTAKVSKLEDKLSAKEDQLRTSKHFATELRTQYIKESDAYKIEFPVNFGRLLNENFSKRKAALQLLLTKGEEITTITTEFNITNDGILDELRNELEYFESYNL